MAEILHFYLNRVQDLLGLPRTSVADYPITTDPLHPDTILAEDIYEAVKMVTLELSRRGTLQLKSAYTPLVAGQADYVLPPNICRLMDVAVNNNVGFTNLQQIPADDYTLETYTQYRATPQYYQLAQSSGRVVYRTGLATASHETAVIDSQAPFTTTLTGGQIDRGDLVFNNSQDSQGTVKRLYSSSPAYSILETDSSTVCAISSDGLTLTLTNDDINLDADPIPSGSILYDDESWLVITACQAGPQEKQAVMTVTGRVYGKSQLVNYLFAGNRSFSIGSPDRVEIEAGDVLISDDQQGLVGGTDKLLLTNEPASGTMEWDGSTSQLSTSLLVDHGGSGYKIELTVGAIKYTGFLGSSGSGNSYSVYTSSDGFLSESPLSLGLIPALPGTVSINKISVYSTSVVDGETYQIEQAMPTLDTISLAPLPDKTDTEGSESLRFYYYSFPEKPDSIYDAVGVPDSLSDALIAKAYEIAKRRETGEVEPFNFTLQRATSGQRQLPQRAKKQPGANVPRLYIAPQL